MHNHKKLIPIIKQLSEVIDIIEKQELKELNTYNTTIKKEIALNELIKTSKISYKINQLIKYINDKNKMSEIQKDKENKRADIQIMKLINNIYLKNNNSKIISLIAKALGTDKESLFLQLKKEYNKLKIYNEGNDEMKDMKELDKEAYELGYNLKDFNEWYKELDFVLRVDNQFKTIKETYHQGINDRVNQHNEIIRVPIFIEGAPNTGKTYTSEQVLRELGESPFIVKGANTGMYDNFDLKNNSIIIDDTRVSNLLNMCDNYIMKLYRRNANNKIWKGTYIVITSNMSIDEYAYKSGITNQEEIKALKSRMVQCKLINGKLEILPNQFFRGTEAQQLKKIELLNNFKNKFNEIIKNYTNQKKIMIQ